MSTVNLYATNPNQTRIDEPIPARDVSINAEIDEPATLVFYVEQDKYISEDATTTAGAANALQLNSLVRVVRNGTNIFRGQVYSRELVERLGESLIKIECLDKMALIRNTMALDSNNNRMWSQITPALALSNVTLYTLTHNYNSNLQCTVNDIYLWYPSHTSAAYLPYNGYSVTGGSQSPTDTFVISGDHTDEFYSGVVATVYDSTGNDGNYTVLTAAYVASPTDETTITVSEAIPSATMDGTIESQFRTNWDTLGQAITNGIFPITALNAATKTITVAGNHADEIRIDKYPEIHNSTNNDTTTTPYTLVSATNNGANTDIVVEEAIDESVVDGELYVGVIELSSSYQGFIPTGLALIENEVIYFDGYVKFNNDGYGWRLQKILRGQLGTTAASHAAGAEVKLLIGKKIHPSQPVLMQGYTSEAVQEWVDVPGSQYTAQVEEGRFDFSISPGNMYIYADRELDDPRRGYDSFRVSSYAVFDELNVNAVTLKSLATDILEAPIQYGGAYLTGSKKNVDIPWIALTKASVSEPYHTLDLLDQIEGEIGFTGNTDVQVISKFYDSQNDQFNYKSITQAASPDIYYKTAEQIDSDWSMEDIFSAICVKYRTLNNVNLVVSERMKPPRIGDLVGSNNVAVYSIIWQTVEQQSGFGWDNEITTYPIGYADQQKDIFGTFLVNDGLSNTGWGFQCNLNPGDSVNALYAWFNEDADSVVVDHVKLVLDLRRESHVTNPISVTVKGIQTFTPPQYDTNGNDVADLVESGEFELAGSLHVEYGAGDDTDDVGSLVLEASGIATSCAAIKIVFDGLPTADSDWFRVKIKEFVVNGYEIKSEMVVLSNDDGFDALQDINWYFAESSFNKLYPTFNLLGADYENQWNRYKVKVEDIGVATRNAALSLGRLALLESLALSQQREYQIGDADFEIPVIGETVSMPDGFTGVVLSVGYQCSEAIESLYLRVLDLEDELI